MSKFLGIDTSCYTTSLAAYDSEKGLICEERIILNMHQLGKSAEEISVLTGCSEEIVLEVLNHGKSNFEKEN